MNRDLKFITMVTWIALAVLLVTAMIVLFTVIL